MLLKETPTPLFLPPFAISGIWLNQDGKKFPTSTYISPIDAEEMCGDAPYLGPSYARAPHGFVTPKEQKGNDSGPWFGTKGEQPFTVL